MTTDTYRTTAIEQLRTYANLLQAPDEVVYDGADFQGAIEKIAHMDHVFIDIVGRNDKEAEVAADFFGKVVIGCDANDKKACVSRG